MSPRKLKEKVCIQCGRSLTKDNFYRHSHSYRRFPRCKECMSVNYKSQKDRNKSSTRVCRKCGEIKPVQEFKTSHGRSYCLDCSSVKKNKTEERCIQCGEIKSIDQFRRIFRKGSKCISCVKRNNRNRDKDRAEYRRILGIVSSHSRCQQCRERKTSEHFTRLENSWNGLSYVCNECKELNKLKSSMRVELYREKKRDK